MSELILMRGASGSGKSYKAKSLQVIHGGIILSADDMFMVEIFHKGVKELIYLWAASALASAHKVTQEKTKVAMANSISPIIIDNTNIKLWHMEEYIGLAENFGYEVSYEESDTPWKDNADECYRRNSHGVPLEGIKRQLADFEVIK